MEKFSQNRTHCPILNTCFEVYSHIINDLCFWPVSYTHLTLPTKLEV